MMVKQMIWKSDRPSWQLLQLANHLSALAAANSSPHGDGGPMVENTIDLHVYKEVPVDQADQNSAQLTKGQRFVDAWLAKNPGDPNLLFLKELLAGNADLPTGGQPIIADVAQAT